MVKVGRRKARWTAASTVLGVVLAVTVGLFVPGMAMELSETGQPRTYDFGLKPADIPGFDGVELGMTMDEVEAVLAAQYPDVEPEKSKDPVLLTSTLHVALEELATVPGAEPLGPATITYVFGAQSERLMNINVNVVAVGDATPMARAAILNAGSAYVAYLLGYVWNPIDVVRGVVVGPNAVILFAGRDAAGRGIEVAVDGVPLDVITLPGGETEHRPVESGSARLRIGLAANPDNPDVFRLPPGSF